MPNRRKRKRSTPARASSTSPRRLLEQAHEALAGGDGRKALALIRQARSRDDRLPGLALASFCASICRARQLAAKGMDREAAAMRATADRRRASLSLPALSETDWARYVRHLDGADALAAYADHLRQAPPMPRVERALADRLVIERGWEGVEALDAGHPLRRDAPAVAPGLDAMDAGDWTRAASLLQGVPRRSPFAAWRLFAKAMDRFGAGDEDGLRRTVERLPPDFALVRTAGACLRLLADGGGAAGTPAALGGERARTTALADDLKHALRKRKTPEIAKAIERLADALHPEDPVRARLDLLEIAGLAAVRIGLSPRAVLRLAQRLAPADRVDGVAARVLLLMQQAAPALWDPAPAIAIFADLPAEFPRAEDQALARARVLEALARTGRAAVHPEFLSRDVQKAVSVLLGRPLEAPRTVFVDLMTASLAADPDNRDGYLFALELLRGQPAAKARTESVLGDMATRFPDDPTPWLELAALHYSKNAYRRAEGALAEARRRAPHDDRLLDLQAVGFLKSADQSRKNGRFALAERDLQRAEDLGRKLLGHVLPAKRLLLEMVSGRDGAAAVVARRLEGRPPAAQLRTLGLLILDLDNNRHIRNAGPEMGAAARRVLAGKAALAGECGAEEVVGLLDPLPAELDVLYPDRRVAAIFADWWPALLERVDTERLPAVLDVVLDCGGWREARSAIEKRLRGVRKARRDPLLVFYLAVLRHQDGRDHDGRRFVDVVKKADAATRERLRAAAVRLARHAQGPLRQALLTFDFELLNAPPAFGPPPGLEAFLAALAEKLESDDSPPAGPTPAVPPGPGGRAAGGRFPPAEEDEADELRQESLFDGDPSGGNLSEELETLERMIDDGDLRGAPESELRAVAGNMRAEPTARRELEQVARDCEAAGCRDTITPELETLLFPRARRKGRRR